MSKEDVENVCDLCLIDEKSVEASVQCSVDLCKECHEKLPAVKLQGLTNIKVKQESYEDKDCFIRGAVLLTNGHLAVIDLNNECVKIINTENGKISQRVKLTLEDPVTLDPHDITVIGDNQLAVTFNNCIQLISLSPQLSVSRTIAGPGYYRGITHNGGKLFLTSVYPVPSVHVFDLTGYLLQQKKGFQKIAPDETGNQLFKKPSNIATNLKGNLIYVSDHDSHKIVCLSRDGGVLETYEALELQNPCGITVDEWGQVYVCSWGADCIFHLSPGGQLGKVLVEKDLKPHTITCDTGKLYISSACWGSDDNNKISVYKLKKRQNTNMCSADKVSVQVNDH